MIKTVPIEEWPSRLEEVFRGVVRIDNIDAGFATEGYKRELKLLEERLGEVLADGRPSIPSFYTDYEIPFLHAYLIQKYFVEGYDFQKLSKEIKELTSIYLSPLDSLGKVFKYLGINTRASVKRTSGANSNSKKGRGMSGKRHIEETRAKMRQSKVGYNPWVHFRIPHSDVRLHMTQAYKLRYKKGKNDT